MAVLAIDQGTSGTKALVVEPGEGVIALAEVPVRPTYGDDGSVEVDAELLWRSVLAAGQQAVAEAGRPIDVVGLANQGETVLAWDRASGAPLTPAMVWQDSRASVVCDQLADHAAAIAARTGLVLDPYFSAPKMAWLRANATADGVITTSDTWLLHKLTGEFVTDVTTASRSLVLDIDSREWSAELLDYFGLGAEALPTLVDNDVIVGSTTAFGAEAPVGGVVVDQQAALFAQRCFDPGAAKCTFGTGAFLLENIGANATRSQSGLTTSVAWVTDSTAAYCVDGQVFTAASAVRWLQDLGLLTSAAEMDSLVAESTSAGVTFVPSLAGLGAPYWKPDATAALFGLRLATTRADIVRAVLEGVAANVADLVDHVGRDSGIRLTRLRVDGGLTASSTLMQLQADLSQVPVDVYPSAHATALGTAALARMAISDLTPDAAVDEWTPVRTYEPQWTADRAAATLESWRAAVAATLDARGANS